MAKTIHSMYAWLRKIWKRPFDEPLGPLLRQRMMEWRRQPSIVRIPKPTRLDRARALGYKAKQGIIVVRVRVRKGGLNKPRPRSGRRPKRMGVYGHTPKKSLQLIAEERAARKYPNLEVLGSYWVGDDGYYKYFEVIMVDPHHPVIRSDPHFRWLVGYERRVKRKAKVSKELLEKVRKAIEENMGEGHEEQGAGS
ncbi:MAG: 50S ribosomal protein L15e [Thermoprotei archaeon]|nr:MAG: 50S ribosomal protein L15e [Thermoprotei archaeon]RLF25482.1 MAG: 50S ribosomal protein L15e [Thermoprotei archaeon]